MQTWVERTCRSRCVAQAVLLGILGVLLLWGTVALAGTAFDAFRGPHPVTADEIRKARSDWDFPHSFVAADCTGAMDTGIVWTKGSEKSSYWAVAAGDRFFLVKAERRPSGRVAGEFKRLESDVSRLLDSEDRAVTLPLFLDEGDPRIALGIFLLVLAGGTAFVVIRCLRSLQRAMDPSRHPCVAALAADGKLLHVSGTLETELTDPGVLRFRGFSFTRSFLVDQRFARFGVYRWRDLVWAHKLVTSHRVYFVIPAGKTFDPVFCFAGRVRVQMQGNWKFGRAAAESTVDKVLQFALERAPWAAAGWSDELEAAWKKDPDGFAAAVAAQRDTPGTGGAAAR